MSKWRRTSRVYTSRKVYIRGKGGAATEVAQLEKLVRDDLKSILREHHEDLKATASMIEEDALTLVPEDTGTLRDSIEVKVFNSETRPGIIAHASAMYRGFDYAEIQDKNEDFSHKDKETFTTKGNRETQRASAHYLSGSFALGISYLFEEITGEELELPENLQHAKDYIFKLL